MRREQVGTVPTFSSVCADKVAKWKTGLSSFLGFLLLSSFSRCSAFFSRQLIQPVPSHCIIVLLIAERVYDNRTIYVHLYAQQAANNHLAFAFV